MIEFIPKEALSALREMKIGNLGEKPIISEQLSEEIISWKMTISKDFYCFFKGHIQVIEL